MDAKSLRIGNFVHRNLENEKSEFIESYLVVNELTEKSITTYYIDLHGAKQLVRGKDGYLPIPITAKWLKLLGFEEVYNSDFRLKFNYPATFLGYDFSKNGRNDIDGFRNHGHYIKIKYVHELQNLFHIITGNELVLR